MSRVMVIGLEKRKVRLGEDVIAFSEGRAAVQCISLYWSPVIAGTVRVTFLP
jgi:hypothetical protein